MNSQILDSLLNHKGIRKNPPALESDIQALLQHLNAELPEELFELWRKSNGFGISSMGADLMSVTQTLEFLGHWDAKLQLGLLPILDTHSSNYVTICYHQPLSSRIAYVPHGDVARLIYLDISRVFEVLVDCLNKNAELEADENFDEYDNELISADEFFYEIEGDYANHLPRTLEDQVTAQSLLQVPETQMVNWNRYFAVQLLGESKT